MSPVRRERIQCNSTYCPRLVVSRLSLVGGMNTVPHTVASLISHLFLDKYKPEDTNILYIDARANAHLPYASRANRVSLRSKNLYGSQQVPAPQHANVQFPTVSTSM